MYLTTSDCNVPAGKPVHRMSMVFSKGRAMEKKKKGSKRAKPKKPQTADPPSSDPTKKQKIGCVTNSEKEKDNCKAFPPGRYSQVQKRQKRQDTYDSPGQNDLLTEEQTHQQSRVMWVSSVQSVQEKQALGWSMKIRQVLRRTTVRSCLLPPTDAWRCLLIFPDKPVGFSVTKDTI